MFNFVSEIHIKATCVSHCSSLKLAKIKKSETIQILDQKDVLI